MKRFFTAAALSALLAVPMLLTGCPPVVRDAIGISNSTLEFGLNEVPLLVFVWNTDPAIASMDIAVSTSHAWIRTSLASVTSEAPPAASGPFDKQSVQISIDRTQLGAGAFEGSVSFSSAGMVTRTALVRVEQDQDGRRDDLVLQTPAVTYTDPYLIDFKFALRDKEDRAVVAEPEAFSLTGSESGVSVQPLLTGLQVRRAASRQLKLELVLDYSLPMFLRAGAVAAMEDAAVNLILSALTEDALAGVTEFHRDDFAASRVQPFTVAHDQVADRIAAIQGGIVFPSLPRLFDALFDAVTPFDSGDAEEEARYIIAFTYGFNIETGTTANDIVAAANDLGVKIYIVTFGEDPDTLPLLDITTRTGGALFNAEDLSGLDAAIGAVVNDLEGQYNVRWASSRRDDTPVFPAFTLSIDGKSVSYSAETPFVSSVHAGNGVLEGKLFFVSSDGEDRTTAFLRAAYAPRFVKELRIFLTSPTPYTVSIVDAASGGLLDGWTLSVDQDAGTGGAWIDLASTDGSAIPFAAFGPMLRFDFDRVVDENTPLFSAVQVDNTPYETTGGQSFVVEGYENTAPGEGEGEGEGPILAVSENAHFFFSGEQTFSFEVWNAATDGSVLTFVVTANREWITAITPNSGESTGPDDKVTVTASSNFSGLLDVGQITVTSTAGTHDIVITWTGL